jgi:hypothetical protein
MNYVRMNDTGEIIEERSDGIERIALGGMSVVLIEKNTPLGLMER